MKRLLFFSLLLIYSGASGIGNGTSREAVLTELGEPQGSMRNGSKEILLFKTGTVTLLNGTVSETDLSAEHERQTEKRALELEKIQAAKQAELDKQKRLFPEDHVIQIDCAYSKTENWDYLPESIRPAAGEYRYDLYIPQGYYESDRKFYPCLFLESPALWDSVKERIRKEKWVVIILPDAAQQQIEQTMNGNFLAAYDDAAGRFRLAKDRRFIAGRVPAAIFATMRSAAGIILQEPDFRGFKKADFNPDFLRKNPDMRVYVLLGNKDTGNIRYQGKFIVERIPRYHIEGYQGETAVLPQPLADRAIDWMKKEYALP